jgi:hypothetical protein
MYSVSRTRCFNHYTIDHQRRLVLHLHSSIFIKPHIHIHALHFARARHFKSTVIDDAISRLQANARLPP